MSYAQMGMPWLDGPQEGGDPYAGIDQAMQRRGGKQYHTGDSIGPGMAFDRPYMGTNDPSTWGQRTGPFGQLTGPQDGSWYVPNDVYNEISPQTSGGDFFSDLPTAFNDMKGGAAIGAMPFGVSGLEQAGMIPMPDAGSFGPISGAGGLDQLASVNQNAYLPESMQTMTDSPVYDTLPQGNGDDLPWDEIMNDPAVQQTFEKPAGDSVLDKFGSAADWMEKHKMASMMGLGLGLGGLQMYGASQAAKRNQQQQSDALARQQQRQQLVDNPPTYSGMSGPGLTPRNQQFDPLDLAQLKKYGQGPEHQFFKVAHGGLPTHAPRGGLESMVHGDGGGQDDTVPAMLSPKEYVFDADTVAALGDGNPDHGAKKLDAMRQRIRQHKRSAPSSKIPPKARSPESYMGAR